MNHALALFLMACLFSGCSAPRLAPPAAPPPSEAETRTDRTYLKRIEHPAGMEISDVRSLFFLKIAPQRSSLQQCDFDYQAETVLSKSKEELFTTMPAHVRSDPEKYHWCFYHKILQLEEDLEKLSFIEEKQKLVVDRYLFLTRLARIFHVDLEDSRYLEFAQHNYKRLRSLYFPR